MNKQVIDIKQSAEEKAMIKKAAANAGQEVTYKPNGSRVMVLPLIEEYKGNVIVPEDVWNKMTSSTLGTAQVVAVGEGSWESGVFVPTTYKVGDVVSVFPNRQEADVVINGVLYLIYPERTIVGKY